MTINVSTYGAVGNGTTDDTTAIQNAINAAQAANDVLEFQANKVYRITNKLIVQQGRATSSGAHKQFFLDGKGSSIKNDGPDFAIEVQPLASIGAGANAIGDISMKNFTVVPPNATVANAKKGIKIGLENKFMYCNNRPVALQDVNLTQLGGRALEIVNAGHFDVVRVTQRDDFFGTGSGAGEGLFLAGLSAGGFCGDMSFLDCQFQGNINNGGGLSTRIVTYAASGEAQLRGVRFERCVWYGSTCRVEATVGGKTNDIWFRDCAWDGPNSTLSQGNGDALEIYASNGGLIDKVYFENPYIVNYNGKGIWMRDDEPSRMQDVHVRGGSVSMCYEPVKCDGAWGFYLDGLAITNCPTAQWALINLTPGCRNFKVDGCTESNNNGTAQYFIAVGDGNTHTFDISNNVSYSTAVGLIYDYAGTPKNLFNNVNY